MFNEDLEKEGETKFDNIRGGLCDVNYCSDSIF